VLVGNGRYYGGRMELFRDANRRDGLLDVCVFPRVKSLGVLGDVLYAAVSGRLPEGNVQRLRAAEFTITAEPGAGFELDGEHAGRLPVKFGVDQERLRVIVP
jgi:diacylglycerol kinase family enzyme